MFEEDAGTLTDYTNQLLQAMQRVYGAQVAGPALSRGGGEWEPPALTLNLSQGTEELGSEQCH